MELIKIYERQFNSTSISPEILKELEIYSEWTVKFEPLGMNEFIQRIYVPESEYRYFQYLNQTISDEINKSDENAILKRTLARRYRVI
jgi:hypothetical protein